MDTAATGRASFHPLVPFDRAKSRQEEFFQHSGVGRLHGRSAGPFPPSWPYPRPDQLPNPANPNPQELASPKPKLKLEISKPVNHFRRPECEVITTSNISIAPSASPPP